MHRDRAIPSMKRSAISGTDTEERPSKKTKCMEPSFVDLMKELQTEIFARVAADSCTDIANCKLSCKLFKGIAEDEHVYRFTSLDKIPIILWSTIGNLLEFMEKCRNYMNPEIMYRQAVVDIFGKKSLKSASELLPRAVNQGHDGALYLTSIVLILSGDKEKKKKGMDLLSILGKQKVRECRMKLKKYLEQIWVKIEKSTLSECCSVTEGNHKNKMLWGRKDYEDNIQCGACLADFEMECLFSEIVYGDVI